MAERPNRRGDRRPPLRGLGVSPGIGAGPVRPLAGRVPEPPAGERHEGDPEAAIAAATAALEETAADLEARAARGAEAAGILDAQALMARDPAVAGDVARRIRTGTSAARAVYEAFGTFREMLAGAGGYMAGRAADLDDIRDRAVARLLSVPLPGIPRSDEPYVLVARDLAPADTAVIDPSTVVAFATAEGGPTSHTAILARAIGVPAVVACPGADELADGTFVLVDGGAGTVTVDPDPEQVAQARRERAGGLAAAAPAGPGRTADGHRVALLANVGGPGDLTAAVEAGAEGIGLYRTEFLFLGRATAPGEEEQARVYEQALAAFPRSSEPPAPVVVRVLDAGADKPLGFLPAPAAEPNPALGERGLRLLRLHPEVLDTQLRALARAAGSTGGKGGLLEVMAPMVADADDAAWFAGRCRGAGIGHPGAMIEIPGAALRAADLAPEVEFFSIGTNDLAQYAAAADREAPGLARLQDPWQPMVLDLIAMAAEAAAAAGKPCGVCGEAAADPALACVLAGLGVTSLSMTPRALPRVRGALASQTLGACQAAADKARHAVSAAAAREAARAVLGVCALSRWRRGANAIVRAVSHANRRTRTSVHERRYRRTGMFRPNPRNRGVYQRPATRAVLAVALAMLASVVAACSSGAPRSAGPARRDSARPSHPPSVRQENSLTADVSATVRRMSVEQKVGQLIVATVPGTSAADGGASLVRRYHLGGVIYFAQNAQNAGQIAAFSNGLQRAAMGQSPGIPLTIGTDEEGGIVSRLGGVLTTFPGQMAGGATRDPALVSAGEEAIGNQLRSVGVNLDYAPVADVNVDPANPIIGVRSFGSDPSLVSEMTSSAIAGFHQAGIATAAKHFPGHGDTNTDSHTGLPVIYHSKGQWQQIDAPPFETAIQGGTDMILSAHISVPALGTGAGPATLSAPIMTGLLRQKLGYNGVITTDSLQMAGVRLQYDNAQIAVHAIQAGCDELLMPEDVGTAYQAVLAAVRHGQISQSRLDASVTRILTLKATRGILTTRHVDAADAPARADTSSGVATAQQLADRSITLLRDSGRLLPLARGARVYVSGPDAGSLSSALAKSGAGTVSSPGLADVIVATVNDAGGDPAQQNAVSGLLSERRPVVVVATGDPYDLGMFPGAGAAIATYSDSPVSMNAVARSLTGALNPAGKLPVAIPGTSGQTVYPFGTGLRY